MRTEVIGMDPSDMDLNKKAQVFAEGVAGLADALEIQPENFILMLKWMLDCAEQTLLECECGNCLTPDNSTKH